MSLTASSGEHTYHTHRSLRCSLAGDSLMCFEGLKQWGISRPGTFSGLVSSRGLSPHVCYSESCGTMEVSFYKGLLQSVILTEVLKVNPDTHLLDKCSTELHPNSEPVYHPPGETNRVHSHQEDLNMPRKRNSQDAATLRCITYRRH